MMVQELRFVTKNPHKFLEFQKLFEGTRYSLRQLSTQIDEIQTENLDNLVIDKLLKAFSRIRHPLFVDHTALSLDALSGFPGGLTDLFWERLKNEQLTQLFGNSGVTAVTLIGYCDGKAIHLFRGELRGKIAASPRGPEGFQWDPIFIPDGYAETFAEMGAKKKRNLNEATGNK